ncbi:MAG: type II toxin-antitoxin system Phd/YefM family antitoxin [Vulcanimicrobiaceae bacterium]
MKLGLREANQRFSAAMRAIRAGEEVVITDRGKPFALIVPMREDDRLLRLERAGLIRLPTRPGPMAPARPVRLKGGVRMADILAEERADR